MQSESTIDRESRQKLYVQIYGILKEKIERCEWPVSAQIPTEDELCRAYNVSKATIRIAISELVRDGYLRKQQGRGTFVAVSMPHLGMALRTIFTEEMYGEGVKGRKEVLVQGVKEPPEDVRSHLRFGEDIFCVLLKRLIDDTPAYVEESYVPLKVFPDVASEDIGRASLFCLIQDRALKKIFKVVQTIEIAQLSGDIPAILSVPQGSHGLVMHRLLLGSDGEPIAYTRLTGTATKYKIQTEFERIR